MNITNFKKNILKTAIGIALASTFASGTLLAEDAGIKEASKSKAKGGAAMMEVIEVTSRKKNNAEPVQQTPLAIAVYGEEQLDAMNVSDLSDLSYTSPGAQFEEVGTFPGVQNFSFRGQGINSSIPSVDPTVGTFIDGMFLGVTYGVVLDMFEIESVEVLRGPQGLLFGRNVTGGAVSMRTKRPDGEFSGKVKVQATDHDAYTYAGTVEGTLIEDKLYGKVVAYHNNDHGYFKNVGTGNLDDIPYLVADNKTVGAIDTSFVRGTLVFEASDDLELILIAESGSIKGDGGVWHDLSTVLDPGTGEYKSNPTNEFTTASDAGSLTDGTWSHAIFETNYQIDENSSITNILAYREVDFASAIDLDGTMTPLLQVAGLTLQNQISNELRYATTLMDGKLDLTVGHYYFQQDIEYYEDRIVVLGGINKFVVGGIMDHTSYGVFVSTDYHISDKLSVSAGARYTFEDKKASVIDSTLGDEGRCEDLGTYICEGQWLDLERDWTSVTPKLGVDYKVNDDTMVYAFWTKGFRSGGVNFRNTKPDRYPAGPTEAEGQDTYEFGVKSDLLDGTLRFNAAYFFTDISDKQSEVNVYDPEVIVLQATLNAGDVDIQGIEMDFVALVTESLTVMGSFAWLDSEYTYKNPDYPNDFGDDLPRLAPISYTLAANYVQDLANDSYLVYQLGYSYRDKNAYADNNVSYFPESKQVTAKIEWNNSDDNLKVALYGKNLLDEARYGNITSGKYGPMQKGRVIGLEVSYLFEE